MKLVLNIQNSSGNLDKTTVGNKRLLGIYGGSNKYNKIHTSQRNRKEWTPGTCDIVIVASIQRNTSGRRDRIFHVSVCWRCVRSL